LVDVEKVNRKRIKLMNVSGVAATKGFHPAEAGIDIRSTRCFCGDTRLVVAKRLIRVATLAGG
jgi:hypothetical protein